MGNCTHLRLILVRYAFFVMIFLTSYGKYRLLPLHRYFILPSFRRWGRPAPENRDRPIGTTTDNREKAKAIINLESTNL